MRKLSSLILTTVFLLSLPLTAFAAEGVTEPTEATSPTETTAATEATVETTVATEATEPPTEPEQTIKTAPTVDQLRIDGTNLYEGMESTYEKGYIPKVSGGKVNIILPLLGKTYDSKVTVTADLGATNENPFVLGNYSQTEQEKDGVYLFHFEIPLAKGRVNGAYPVTLTAKYLDVAGNQAQQDFTVYVTITDGLDPASQNVTPPISSGKEAVETPKLFISACKIEPAVVGGGEEFTVTVTIENIGSIRARTVLLTYGSDNTGIVPANTNNVIHLENIASGKSEMATLAFKTTKDVLAGNQSFYVKLSYVDLYGGTYSESLTFLVPVTQPTEMGYDPITVPKQVTTGETISLPVHVFNTGKSPLHNVSASISGSGLIPTSSVFLGNIKPGESGAGTIEVYISTLSMIGGANDYGKTNGTYAITYTDDNGEKHTTQVSFSTEIIQPVTEDEKEDTEEQKTVGQWWISVLVAFAVISIIVTVIVVSKFTRMMRMK